MTSHHSAEPNRLRTASRIALAVALAVATTAAWVSLGPELVPAVGRWLERLGAYVPFAFVGLGALAIAVCAPASLVYVTGGMLFGVWRGLLLCSAAAMLGSTIAFFVARSVLGARIGRLIARSARLDRFERALSSRGLWFVALLRLSLLAPIGPVSYALGVMRISVRSFVWAMPALVPPVLVYVYAGHIARGLVDGRGAREAWEWVVLGAGFAATALVTVWIGRAAQRALAVPRAVT